jgi:LysR family transcriptional activator of glutamate synthase operon
LLNDESRDLFDIRRLALLVEVVEQGSITAAAELMMYTPSAVSQQLRKLEQEVGQPLLNRRSRGVVPTEAGQVLAGHARKIVGQMRAAQSDLDQIAGLKRGSLTIGTFPDSRWLIPAGCYPSLQKEVPCHWPLRAKRTLR